MKNSGNKKIFQMCLFVLVAIVVLGIGYAGVSAIKLYFNGSIAISPDQSRFKVQFVTAQRITGTPGVGGTATVDYNDKTVAHFSISGLNKAGDYAEATYVVKNYSNNIGADISLQLSNSNPSYFKVTEIIESNILQAGDTTLAKIRVEMIKSPVDDPVTTDVSARLVAKPVDNNTQTGEEKTLENPESGIVYYVGADIRLDETVPQSGIYDNYNEAIQNYGHPMFLQVNMINGLTKEMDMGFIKNDKLYYLKGYVNETNLTEKPVYESNKNILIESFGEDKCSIESGNISCEETTNDIHKLGYADTAGWVFYREISENTDSRCTINAGGHNGCD